MWDCLKKQYYILQKYNSEVGTDGRTMEQAEKPLQVKDITNVFKGYFFRAAKTTANRAGNRTGGEELKNKFCININTLWNDISPWKQTVFVLIIVFILYLKGI